MSCRFYAHTEKGGRHAFPLRSSTDSQESSWEFLIRYQLRSLRHMYRRDNPPFWRTVGHAMRFLFARGGPIRGNWAHYWKFFRKDFHPNDIDDTVVLDRAIDLYGLAH